MNCKIEFAPHPAPHLSVRIRIERHHLKLNLTTEVVLCCFIPLNTKLHIIFVACLLEDLLISMFPAKIIALFNASNTYTTIGQKVQLYCQLPINQSSVPNALSSYIKNSNHKSSKLTLTFVRQTKTWIHNQ